MESLSPWSLLNNGTLLIEEPLARIGNLIIYQGIIISGQSEKPKVLIHELFPDDILLRVRATSKLRLISTERAAAFENEKKSFNYGFEELKRKIGKNSHGLYAADFFSENGTVYAVVGYKPDQVIVDDLYWDTIKDEFCRRAGSKTQSISDLWKNVMEAAERQISPARSPEKSLEIGNRTNSEKGHGEQTRGQGVLPASDMSSSRKPATNPEANQNTRSSNKNTEDDGLHGTTQDWDVLLGLGASENQKDGKNPGNSNQGADNLGGHRTSDHLEDIIKDIITEECFHERTSRNDRRRKISLTHDRAQKIIIVLFIIMIIQVVILLFGVIGQNINFVFFSHEGNYCNNVKMEEATILSEVHVAGSTTSWS